LILPSRYQKIGNPFSGGGMSTAFKCKDIHLDRDVLVKLLQPNQDPKRILDEVKALSALRSKHVVQIYDVVKNSSGEFVALIEEYLPGKELGELVPVKDFDAFLRYMYAISSGLSDIHEFGIVHRDIKPNNMKIDAEGCLRIFDFGLSRTEGVNCDTIGTVGTPGYIAPELCAPSTTKVDFTAAVDVFAFGATALKLMRGTLPPEMKSIPPKIPNLSADFSRQTMILPTAIAKIFNQCLSANPQDRPSMSAVKAAIGHQLLKARHKATMIASGKVHYLDKPGSLVTLSAKSLGSVDVSYDGYDFIAANPVGDVYINNTSISSPQKLTGACVVTLGAPSKQNLRQYITFDITHPEVVL
jgi:eukaryotic-like serine/threonine-protein kinase